MRSALALLLAPFDRFIQRVRHNLVSYLRAVTTWLKSDTEVLEEIMLQKLQLTVIRIGLDLRVFNILSSASRPQTARQLAQFTGSEEDLIGRLLRYLASVHLIRETSKDTYAATRISRILANQGNQAGIYHYHDHVGPILQVLPQFLSQTGYRNPTDTHNTAFQHAYNTKLSVFEWYPRQKPETFAQFNKYMAARRDSLPTWLSVYPLQHEIKQWSTEKSFFVDVAGGIGFQCAELLQRYPALSGRVVLEDIAECISQADPTSGIQKIVQDIFEAQQVQGARYYHLRGVLHDFPDGECRLILRNIRLAMSEDSVILIEDMVLPEVGVTWQAAQIDLVMMAGLSATERTRAQWTDLLASVGLQIAKILPIALVSQESLIVVYPAHRDD